MADTLAAEVQQEESAKAAALAARQLTHPDLRPRNLPKRQGSKMRRTTVRSAKLVNMEASRKLGNIQINQVPIEPSHNNHGVLDDPSMPLRHYLNKGWRFPHEVVEELLDEGLKFPKGKPVPKDFLYCAVQNCWEPATMSSEESGTERCQEHEEAWREGWIRYAVRHK